MRTIRLRPIYGWHATTTISWRAFVLRSIPASSTYGPGTVVCTAVSFMLIFKKKTAKHTTQNQLKENHADPLDTNQFVSPSVSEYVLVQTEGAYILMQLFFQFEFCLEISDLKNPKISENRFPKLTHEVFRNEGSTMLLGQLVVLIHALKFELRWWNRPVGHAFLPIVWPWEQV